MSTSAYTSPTTKEGLRHRTAKTRSDDSSCSPIAELDADLREQEAFERELLAIWLDSNIGANRDDIQWGAPHKITWSNTSAVFRLLRTSRFTRPLLRHIAEGLEVRLLALFIGHVILQFCPLFKAYLNSVLVDLVLNSSKSESATWFQALGVAVKDMLLRSLETVIDKMHRKNQSIIEVHVNERFECGFIASSTQLSLRARVAPLIQDLQSAAQVKHRGYFRAIEYGLFRVPAMSAAVAAQIWVLLRILSSASVSVCSVTWLYGAMSLFAPLLLRNLIEKIGEAVMCMDLYSGGMSVNELLSGEPEELIIYGCQDWTMEKRREITKKELALLGRGKGKFVALSLGEEITSRVSDKLFEIILASRVIQLSSMGSFTMCQETLLNVLRATETLRNRFAVAYSTVISLAAYLLAIRLPEQPTWLQALTVIADKKDRYATALTALRELSTPESAVKDPLLPNPAVKIDYDLVRAGGMSIEARDLGFRYPGQPTAALKGVTLRIEAGETVAIVGFNGGGKTTLLKVLMGLWGKPDEGELLINGHPVEHYSPSTLHRRTACLFQDFRKYNGSLRENLQLRMTTNADEEPRLQSALKQGGAEAILEKVGYEGHLSLATTKPRNSSESDESDSEDSNSDGSDDSSVSSESDTEDCASEHSSVSSEEDNPGSSAIKSGKRLIRRLGVVAALCDDPEFDGTNPYKDVKYHGLSGGQWQRVALSRAFYHSERADLVAFDEPSSALDPKAEVELFHRIHALAHAGDRKRTTIYISHRFSTVRKADKIAVVADGTVTEFGTHAELMALEGRYHELFTLQQDEWKD